jgi:hypothetical protein
MKVKILFISASKIFQMFFDKSLSEIHLDTEVTYLQDNKQVQKLSRKDINSYEIAVCDNSIPGSAKGEYTHRLEENKLAMIIASRDKALDRKQKQNYLDLLPKKRRSFHIT